MKEITLKTLFADLSAENLNEYAVLGKRHQGEEPDDIKALLTEYDKLLRATAEFGLSDVMLVSSNNAGVSFIGNSPSIVSAYDYHYLSVSVIAKRLDASVDGVRISDSSRAAIEMVVAVTPDSIVRAIAKCLSALYPSCIVSDMLAKVTHPHKELSEYLK